MKRKMKKKTPDDAFFVLGGLSTCDDVKVYQEETRNESSRPIGSRYGSNWAWSWRERIPSCCWRWCPYGLIYIYNCLYVSTVWDRLNCFDIVVFRMKMEIATQLTFLESTRSLVNNPNSSPSTYLPSQKHSTGRISSRMTLCFSITLYSFLPSMK